MGGKLFYPNSENKGVDQLCSYCTVFVFAAQIFPEKGVDGRKHARIIDQYHYVLHVVHTL